MLAELDHSKWGRHATQQDEVRIPQQLVKGGLLSSPQLEVLEQFPEGHEHRRQISQTTLNRSKGTPLT